MKKAAKITDGSKEPGRASAGTVTMAQVRDVAKLKMKDLNTDNLDAAVKTIAGHGALDGSAGCGVKAWQRSANV